MDNNDVILTDYRGKGVTLYRYKVRLFNHKCTVCKQRIIYALHKCKTKHVGWINCSIASKNARRDVWKATVIKNFNTAVEYETFEFEPGIEKYIKINKIIQCHEIFELIESPLHSDTTLYSMDI